MDALPPSRRPGPAAGRAGLLPTAIEELLRYDTPLSLFERWVLEPIEVDGVEIPRGEEVALLFGAANRDPDAFVDPDGLDLARDPNPYLSFGAGIHYCLGAPLAKMELAIAFGTLLRRRAAARARRGAALEADLRAARARVAPGPALAAGGVRYVALGDSYTIGTSVRPPSAGRTSWSRRSAATPDRSSWWPTSG